jgi:hypothetical protein
MVTEQGEYVAVANERMCVLKHRLDALEQKFEDELLAGNSYVTHLQQLSADAVQQLGIVFREQVLKDTWALHAFRDLIPVSWIEQRCSKSFVNACRKLAIPPGKGGVNNWLAGLYR